MARRSTGKRLRFEVFERDQFTCQYCGAQPPDAILVLDHIHPASQSGESTADNLITACEPCNQGKAGRVLGNAQPRPDADLMYLKTMQEIAELQRYQQAAAVKEYELGEVTRYLQKLWSELSELDWYPKPRIIQSLIERHGPEIAERAIRDVAPKVGTGYIKRYDSYDDRKWVAYIYAVARNMEAEAGG